MEEDEFSTDWNVEKYKNEDMLEDHWKLRKIFIEMYKTKYPEEYLVELSKAYIYLEVYDNIFSAPLMKLLKELSQNIPKVKKVEEEPPPPSKRKTRKQKRA
ncbi:hypothetical protein Trydic_g11884 [Trypoxylus dichotomus]